MPGKLLEAGDARESNIRAFTEFYRNNYGDIRSGFKRNTANEKEFPLAFYTGQITHSCGWQHDSM